jgi:hypothetical protein
MTDRSVTAPDMRTHPADRAQVLADCRDLGDDRTINLKAAWVADLILDAEQDDEADWRAVANRLRSWCNVAGSGDLATALAIAERHVNKEGGDRNRTGNFGHSADNATPAPDALGERAPSRIMWDDERAPTIEENLAFETMTEEELLAGAPPAPSPVAGMETSEADRRLNDPNCDCRLCRTRRDLNRALAEIARLTAELAEAQTERDRWYGEAFLQKRLVDQAHPDSIVHELAGAPPAPSPVAGMKTIDAEWVNLIDIAKADGDARQLWFLEQAKRDRDRQSAEIARLTAELAEARAKCRSWEGAAHEYEEQARFARADAAKAMEEDAKILDGMAAAEGALFLGAARRGDHIRSIMFNAAANAYRAGAAVIRARSTESETPEQAKPPFPREWDDPR